MREGTAQVKIYVCLVIKRQQQLLCLLRIDYYCHVVNWYCHWPPPPPSLHWRVGALLAASASPENTFISDFFSMLIEHTAICSHIPSDLATHPLPLQCYDITNLVDNFKSSMNATCKYVFDMIFQYNISIWTCWYPGHFATRTRTWTRIRRTRTRTSSQICSTVRKMTLCGEFFAQGQRREWGQERGQERGREQGRGRAHRSAARWVNWRHVENFLHNGPPCLSSEWQTDHAFIII